MAHLAPWRLAAKEFDSREAASRTGPKRNESELFRQSKLVRICFLLQLFELIFILIFRKIIFLYSKAAKFFRLGGYFAS